MASLLIALVGFMKKIAEANASDAEKGTARKEGREHYFTNAFILGANLRQFGRLIEGLENT